MENAHKLMLRTYYVCSPNYKEVKIWFYITLNSYRLHIQVN